MNPKISKAPSSSKVLLHQGHIWPLAEKHAPLIVLHGTRESMKNRGAKCQHFPAPSHAVPGLTCCSSWKFFSKTRSMWSRRAACSCSCKVPLLPFNTKQKWVQLLRSSPNQPGDRYSVNTEPQKLWRLSFPCTFFFSTKLQEKWLHWVLSQL